MGQDDGSNSPAGCVDKSGSNSPIECGRAACRAPTAPHQVGVQGSGFRVQGSGFRVQGLGLRVRGSGFRVQGSGFRV